MWIFWADFLKVYEQSNFISNIQAWKAKCPEINNMYTNRAIRPSIIIISSPYSLKQTEHKVISKNVYEQPTLKPSFSFILARFFLTQSSRYSQWKVLQETTHSFGNKKIRYLAIFGAQPWFWCCFVMPCQNRCPMTLQMMDDEEGLAQWCLGWMHSGSAMEDGEENSRAQASHSCENGVVMSPKGCWDDEQTMSRLSSLEPFWLVLENASKVIF